MKLKLDALDMASFLNGLVFFAPVSLLVRTMAGISLSQFFLLQAVISCTIFAGEVPCGIITDRIGYRRTLIINQLLNLMAVALLFAAFTVKSMTVFLAEAVIEGIAVCSSSGTVDAYLYNQTTEDTYLARMARWGNCSEAGFIVSTVAYGGMFALGGIPLLLAGTLVARIAAAVCSFWILPDAPVRITEPTVQNKGIAALLWNRRCWLAMITSGCLTVAGILINFFYVDKLAQLNLNAGWMTGIILAYTVFSMLDEPLLRHLQPAQYRPVLMLGAVISASLMVIFALSSQPVPVLCTMVLLPFSLSLCGFYVTDLQNRIIDESGQAEHRATCVSLMNMIGNGIEIAVLLASAGIAGLGLVFWYLTVAAVLVISCGVLYVIK